MIIIKIIRCVGTPGAGKSYLAKKIAEEFNLEFLELSKIIMEKNFTDGYDDNLDCPILDEDKVNKLKNDYVPFKNINFKFQLLDHLEPIMQAGGNVVEYHSCEFFPERWFHSVYVVKCDTNILFKRLEERYLRTFLLRNLNINSHLFIPEATIRKKFKIILNVKYFKLFSKKPNHHTSII